MNFFRGAFFGGWASPLGSTLSPAAPGRAHGSLSGAPFSGSPRPRSRQPLHVVVGRQRSAADRPLTLSMSSSRGSGAWDASRRANSESAVAACDFREDFARRASSESAVASLRETADARRVISFLPLITLPAVIMAARRAPQRYRVPVFVASLVTFSIVSNVMYNTRRGEE